MQNSLKLVYEHLRNYQIATKAMNANISKIPSFIKNNPTIEAEWQLPPVSNVHTAESSTIIPEPIRGGENNSNWSSPSARNIQLDHSKIFQSTMPLCCLYRTPIKDFI